MVTYNVAIDLSKTFAGKTVKYRFTTPTPSIRRNICRTQIVYTGGIVRKGHIISCFFSFSPLSEIQILRLQKIEY